MHNKYTRKLIQKIRELYTYGYGQRHIGRLLHLPWQSIIPHVKDISKDKRINLPSRGVVLPLSKSAQSLSEAKARIIGYLMGDGCLCTYNKKNWRYTKKGRKEYRYEGIILAFYNIEPSVIHRFLVDCKEVYDLNLRYNQNRKEIKIYRKEVFRDLAKYGPYSSNEWRIPPKILKKDLLLKEWLKAFYDCESYVENTGTHKRIVLYSINKTGLLQIKQALKTLNIPSRLNGPYEGTYRLRLSGKSNLLAFHKKVNFYHSNKREKLVQLLKEYETNKE